MRARTFVLRMLLLSLCSMGATAGELAPGKDGNDVPAGSPLRTELNTVLHGLEPGFDGKYVYKVMWASDRYAYACYLMLEKDGSIQMTDEAYDLSRIVLEKRGGKWVKVSVISGFATTKEATECALVFDGSIDNALLGRVVKAYPAD